MKTQITYDEYLAIEGLRTLARQTRKEHENIEKAIANIVEQENEGHNYYGHISDSMFEDYGAIELLRKLDIVIKPQN